MPIIDSINEIQDLLKDDEQYSVKLGLTGFAAANRYPRAKVLINDAEVWNGTVNDTVLSFRVTVFEDWLNIKIYYFDKTDNDTIVQDGSIIENQYIKINYLECNHLCILGHSIANISLTNYNLTDSQKQAYTANNAHWENIKTDSLYNNGTWEVNLKKPIVASLIKQKQITQNIFEMPHTDVLSKLQQYFKD